MAVHNAASWSGGSILFGGSEMYQVNAGSTVNAAPVGIGGALADNTRYIVFWDKNSPESFQTIVETAYVNSKSRVIIFEVTGAAEGEKVQIVSKDTSFGASDKLNSDSFNKIVAAEFATGPLSGVDNASGIPGVGVAFDSAGIRAYDGSSTDPLMNLNAIDLRFYTSDSSQGKLMAKYSGADVRFYDQTSFNATNATTTAVLSGKSLTFFDDSGFGAGNETVALIGNYSSSTVTDADYVGNNGLAIYGTTATAFSGSGSNLINFQTAQASPSDYGYIGMYTTGGLDYLTMAVKANNNIYLFANETPGSANGSIFLAPATTNGGVTQIGLGSSGSVSQTWRMTSGSAITQIWTFPTAAPSAGQYLEADTYGSLTATLKWSTPTASTLHSTATASGSVPTSSYGTFRYDTDGGGGTEDVLAFASGQTNATPAAATQQSSFWTMLSEGDASSNRLIFEPIVSYSSASGFDNYSYIGYHNYIYGINGYYHNAGDGSASFPGFAFSADGNTGFYRIASGRVGYSSDGTNEFYFDTGIYPATDSSGGTGGESLGAGSQAWHAIHGYTLYMYNAAATTGTDLIVTGSGQIAKKSSSIQYKDNVKELVYDSSKLDKLRPVSYDYKLDNAPDIGLIAEEVDEIYPELINYDKHGKAESIKYHGLSVMLLEEMKNLRKEIKELKEKS